MTEVLIHCDGYTSEELMAELAPFVDESVRLELRPRTPRVRSGGIDPNVLAAIIEASGTITAALIVMAVEWRKHRDSQLPKPGGPIIIRDRDGTTIEVPADADPGTLTALVEKAQRIERPRIYLA